VVLARVVVAAGPEEVRAALRAGDADAGGGSALARGWTSGDPGIDRDVLDTVSAERLVVVVQYSVRRAVVNSCALGVRLPLAAAFLARGPSGYRCASTR
jgi:hypothetical protein